MLHACYVPGSGFSALSMFMEASQQSYISGILSAFCRFGDWGSEIRLGQLPNITPALQGSGAGWGDSISKPSVFSWYHIASSKQKLFPAQNLPSSPGDTPAPCPPTPFLSSLPDWLLHHLWLGQEYFLLTTLSLPPPRSLPALTLALPSNGL